MQSKPHAKRFNDNKVDLTLLPEVASYEEAKVWMFGERKYGRDNWRTLWGEKTTEVAAASLLRHAIAIASGELYDGESGLPHAAHIRCNAAMILEGMSRDNLIDHQVYEPSLSEETKAQVEQGIAEAGRGELSDLNTEVLYGEETSFHPPKVKISYTEYSEGYAGGYVGYTKYAIVPKTQLASYEKQYNNVRILGETDSGLDGTYYVGGSI